jgi:hypothetical protein
MLQYRQPVIDSLVDGTVGNHADDATHRRSSKRSAQNFVRHS